MSLVLNRRKYSFLLRCTHFDFGFNKGLEFRLDLFIYISETSIELSLHIEDFHKLVKDSIWSRDTISSEIQTSLHASYEVFRELEVWVIKRHRQSQESIKSVSSEEVLVKDLVVEELEEHENYPCKVNRVFIGQSFMVFSSEASEIALSQKLK